ncbi:RILP-like protein homolog isoform X1 [Chrysoperla carnea]|uniref:RILP-like protein homolog isoform X1 n=1 Tax=Chrysoperla carnea TaxID=189513 RepID=UPI001D078904|nr:RILP-like protein homolog isoform X1 [Chrysoperla carnea]
MPKITQRRDFFNMEDTTDINEDVSVIDVYDIASDIGKECEKIIDQFGADAVNSLMPKVINALELLENLAMRNERENITLQELKSRIAQLETDKIEKAEYRERFEKELEIIDEQWRNESKELVSLVSRLQEENRRLAKSSTESDSDKSAVSTPTQEIAMLERLRALVDKQRDELRAKEKIILERNEDIENLSSQVERLSATTRELRRKQRALQTQTRTLCDERADFLVQMQDQQRELNVLRKRFNVASKQAEDLAKVHSEIPDLSNKIVYDLDDPNRPRFTTTELKAIFNERNELKARISDLEEELDGYRPKEKVETLYFRTPVGPYDSAVDALTSLELNNQFPIDDDAPVQGPLPYEPDDAPWKKSESGIRKFFRKLFSEGNSSGQVGRSLSTLSKLALSANNGGDATV